MQIRGPWLGEEQLTTVLVVEDGATDRELLATVLRYAGYAVVEAASGRSGLDLAREAQPDLIVADILMPTMDGYELMRELRSDSKTAQTPVVFYTATYVVDEARRLAGACGVWHIIVKPCEPEEIIRVVADAIESGCAPVVELPSEEFHRDHLRALNAKLVRTVEELREVMVVAGTLHQRSDREGDNDVGAALGKLRPAPANVLSPRELQVLAAVADGHTNAEIGERLVIAPTTVQSHMKSILRKLGARNRTEAAARYLRDRGRL